MMRSISPFRVITCLEIQHLTSHKKQTLHAMYNFNQNNNLNSVLMLLALSSKAISVPYIGKTQSLTIDSDLYVQKCSPQLLAFIRRYHADDNEPYSEFAYKPPTNGNEHQFVTSVLI